MNKIRIDPAKRTAHGSPRRVTVFELNECAASDENFEWWVRITHIPGGEYEGSKPEDLPDDVPRYVPVSQAYYWTKRWQEGERETQRDLEAGNYVEFSGEDPDEIRRWLCSDGDE